MDISPPQPCPITQAPNPRVETPPDPRWPHLDLFEDAPQLGVVGVRQRPEVGPVDARVGITPGTHVVVDVISFRGQDAHAAAVEPVLARVTADVEPGDGGGRRRGCIVRWVLVWGKR